MLKAKLDSARKNKKGFSLIELIIVVAIMVALIAVLAPSYVKYVQKSRDAALTTAAEDFGTAIKTYFADPDAQFSAASNYGTIHLELDASNKIAITYLNGATFTDSCKTALIDYSGIDSSKVMGKSVKTFDIVVSSTGAVTVKAASDKAA